MIHFIVNHEDEISCLVNDMILLFLDDSSVMTEELTLFFLFCEMCILSSSYQNAGIELVFISKWTARSLFSWSKRKRREF